MIKQTFMLFVLASILLLSGCSEITDALNDSIDDNNAATEERFDEISTCPNGSITPYGDIQLDSQCQAACSYLEAGQDEGGG